MPGNVGTGALVRVPVFVCFFLSLPSCQGLNKILETSLLGLAQEQTGAVESRRWELPSGNRSRKSTLFTQHTCVHRAQAHAHMLCRGAVGTTNGKRSLLHASWQGRDSAWFTTSCKEERPTSLQRCLHCSKRHPQAGFTQHRGALVGSELQPMERREKPAPDLSWCMQGNNVLSSGLPSPPCSPCLWELGR